MNDEHIKKEKKNPECLWIDRKCCGGCGNSRRARERERCISIGQKRECVYYIRKWGFVRGGRVRIELGRRIERFFRAFPQGKLRKFSFPKFASYWLNSARVYIYSIREIKLSRRNIYELSFPTPMIAISWIEKRLLFKSTLKKNWSHIIQTLFHWFIDQGLQFRQTAQY